MDGVGETGVGDKYETEGVDWFEYRGRDGHGGGCYHGNDTLSEGWGIPGDRRAAGGECRNGVVQDNGWWCGVYFQEERGIYLRAFEDA